MQTTTTDAPRLAIIGCGAIAEKFYLPALARHSNVLSRLVLVDSSAERASQLAARFGAQHTETDYHNLLGKVDGAIVATPHAWHFPISKEFLAAGAHVLCEKPLTETSEQGAELVALAKEHGRTISVNNTRRLFPSTQKIKSLIAGGEIGKLKSIRFHEGGVFDWPTATGFYFSGKNPRGVLLDKGAHVLDLVCFWLGAKPRLVLSQNDSFGGAECVSLTKFEYDGCECEIRLSWLTKLDNKVEIVGERGKLIQGAYENSRLTWIDSSGREQRLVLPSKAASYNEFAYVLIDNFLDIMAGRAQPMVPGSAVLDSLTLLNECYDAVTRFDMPWELAYEAI